MKKDKTIKKQKNKGEKVTGDMMITDVISKYPETAEILFGMKMHCVGCPMASYETLEQGAMAHGMHPDEFVKKINELIKQKEDVENGG